MTTTEMQARMREIDNQQSRLERQARELGGGEFTDAARQQYDELTTEYKQLESKLTAILPRRTSANSGAPIATTSIDNETATLTRAQPRQRFLDKHGDPVNVFAAREPFGEVRNELSIGRYVRGVATGNWNGAADEKKLFMNSGASSGSHFAIPEELSGQVIDLARANTVLASWGAQTAEMTSDTLNIATIAADPTFAPKAEDDAFTPQEQTFAGLALHARTLGAVIKCSREEAEDAINFPQILEQTLRRAFAVELDRLALVGNGGSDGVNGIVNRVSGTGSIGAIDWLDFHAESVSVRAANHVVNGAVMSPTILGDLQSIVSGDGVNATRGWLGAPPSLAGVQLLGTSGMPDATALIGDGSQILLGFRRAAFVEMSTQAGESFLRHQLYVKLVCRFDVGLLHSAAIRKLEGITT